MMWFSASIFPLFILGLVVWMAIASIKQIVVAIRPFKSRTGFPECARCSYNVTGLRELTCPECGSDLLEVGIRGWRGVENPRQTLGNGIAGVACLSFLVMIIAAILLSAIDLAVWSLAIGPAMFAIGSLVLLELRKRIRGRYEATRLASRPSDATSGATGRL